MADINPCPSTLDHGEVEGNGAWKLGLTEATVDLGLPAQAHYSNYFSFTSPLPSAGRV